MTSLPGKTRADSSQSLMKTTNIFDKIQTNLDQKVFNGITPRPRVLKFITEEMRKVLTPELGFDPIEFMDIYLTGSLTTYQYSETSDCDNAIFIKWDQWPTGEDPNTIRRKIVPIVMQKLDGSFVPGTEHPIQHFVVPPGIQPTDMFKSGLRSAYSYRDHKWLVPPEKDRVHDVSVELPVLWQRARLMEDKMNVLLATNPIYAKEFWHQIHRKRTMDQKNGLGDFSEGNIVYKLLLHDGYFDRIRDELGEKISKMTWDENFQMDDQYVPPVGSVWTVSDPWAATKNPPGPSHRTVQITGNEGFYIWYTDLDTQTGKDQSDGISVKMWNEWMSNGRIRQKADDWTFQESPEEAAEYWPDTLPENWARVATMGYPESLDELVPGQQYTLWSPRGLYLLSLPGALPPEGAPKYLTYEGLQGGHYIFNGITYDPKQVQGWLDKQLLHLFQPPNLNMGLITDPAELLVPDTLPENWSKQAATLRLFIAFDPPDETVQQIIQWQQQNAPEGVRLHTPDMLHMTLAFLGNVEESEVPRLLQIINSLDPSAVTISGPEHYEEIRGKQGILVWQESGGNAVWQELNQLLNQWNGYTPQYEPWLPHTTVWEYPGGTGEGYSPPLPVIPAWSPVRVGLYKSEKAPEGGGRFTLITKTADDLSWVDKSTPYGTPDGGAVTGPEHWGDDSIDMPSEPHRDLVPPDNIGLKDPEGSLKVIYDFERDQIILGDVRKADQFPPGQIIGDYRDGDVYLNSHAEAWFNANYFKRLWQHSFPKRPIRHVILDKGNGHHEVVHRSPTSAILGTYEAHQEDQAGLEERRQDDDQAQSQGAEPLQVTAVEEYGHYYWPDPHEIMQAGVDSVEATGQPHPGFRQGAEAAIDSARGAAINRHLGMFGQGGLDDPYELAGHLIWRIQATQMAVDGNKRMAATTGLSWLSMHGFDVSHLPQDDTFFKVVEQSATMNEDEGPELIANFLRQYVTPEDDAVS